MAEYFKQLISQLAAVWQRLSLQQKFITSSLFVCIFIGFVSLLLWTRSGDGGTPSNVLYSNLDIEEAAQITEKLQEGGYSFSLENNGRTITVDGKKVYEIRMFLARQGLPKSHGVGYEIFDKTNFGMTDFIQKLNSRRALEGELRKTIEGLEEVKAARVHIVIPEPTIFLDKQKETKASVVIRTAGGAKLKKGQISGIMHIVASSVEGLEAEHISIVDFEGRLLSSPFGDDATALASSRNVELQQNVETYLEKKALSMLSGVLGPNKAYVKISADMDFDKVERTLEQFNPENRVVRSEERTDENTKNAPDGDHRRERSLTNYEIDKTVQHIMQEVGNVKRLTISVAVDGKYVTGENEERTYADRSAEELQKIEEMVKNSVGYDLARGDQISVANVQFDNEFLNREQESIKKQEMMELRIMIAKYAAMFVLAILFIFFLRYLARTLADAMNPPVPSIEPLGIEEEVPVEVPETVRRQSEILERVEMMSREEPVNIAMIIRQWLGEGMGSAPVKKKSK